MNKDPKLLGIEEAYKLYIALLEKKDEMYYFIREGINIKFDIHDYFKGTIQLNHKTGCYESLWGTKPIPRKEIYSELEDREKLIKEEIEKLLPDGLSVKEEEN